MHLKDGNSMARIPNFKLVGIQHDAVHRIPDTDIFNIPVQFTRETKVAETNNITRVIIDLNSVMVFLTIYDI